MTKTLKNISFFSLFALILVMAVATVVDKVFGTETALISIYNAWWFVALWGICVIFAVIYAVRSDLRKNLVAAIVHFAFVLILAGAFVSFLTSQRGFVHLRQGEILNYYLIPEKDGGTVREALPFNVKLLMFSKTPLVLSDIEGVRADDGKANRGDRQKGSFFSYLQIDGNTCCVWLNHIYKYKNYRFYQYEYDSDERGVTLLVNRDPAGIAITYAGYLLLLVSGLWLLFVKLPFKGTVLLTAVTAVVWLFISQIKPMTPVLRSPMLAAHVSVIMVSYAILLIIAVLSAIYLVRESINRRQPSAENRNSNIERLTSTLLFPAVFLLAFGIFIGAVWANVSWGRYWGWDSKETWALITLLVYAIPFHKRAFPKFRDAKFLHRYLLVAFLSVLMTFLGVSFLLGGLHSYL
ncbi:MAG: cytochrome c biogenesis protein CcsA [Prevotellaceae bacterium]|jgi:ABC-type transport system involved in cytochrome c biogenesis permease subunit|nr:cytochrome c biogenesis protein CcsA [Prevotellaceae bacterium]